LDQNLTLNKHVSSLSRNIYFYIRPSLTESIAASLGASLMQSRLDYLWNVSIKHAQTTVCQKFSYSCGSAFSSPSFSK